MISAFPSPAIGGTGEKWRLLSAQRQQIEEVLELAKADVHIE
jgi:hypothetical protein